MKSKTILVTGGAGFLGAALVRALHRAGHNVRALDDFSRGGEAAGQHRLADLAGKVELRKGDVRDLGAVTEAMRGCDSVVHMAAINGTRHFYEKPGAVLDVGIRGTMTVLDALKATGVPELISASTSEVYQLPPQVPTPEDVPFSVPDPTNPRYSYAASKQAGEMLVRYHEVPTLKRWVIFRPHNVYGRAMGHEHVIPDLTRKLVALEGQKNPTLTLQGDGSQTRSFIHVDDFTAALMLVMDKAGAGSTVHLGTEEEITIRTLAEKLATALGMKITLATGPEAAGGTPRRCPDTARLRALGFAPKVSLEAGLADVAQDYAAHYRKAA